MPACEDCQAWFLDVEKAWQPVLDGEENILPRPRPLEEDFCKAVCPRYEYDLADMSERNEACYAHYLETQAVGATEEEKRDTRFRFNAAIIHQTEVACFQHLDREALKLAVNQGIGALFNGS